MQKVAVDGNEPPHPNDTDPSGAAAERTGYCIYCGYQLGLLRAGRCSECAEVFSRVTGAGLAYRDWPFVRAYAVADLLVVGVATLAIALLLPGDPIVSGLRALPFALFAASQATMGPVALFVPWLVLAVAGGAPRVAGYLQFAAIPLLLGLWMWSNVWLRGRFALCDNFRRYLMFKLPWYLLGVGWSLFQWYLIFSGASV